MELGLRPSGSTARNAMASAGSAADASQRQADVETLQKRAEHQQKEIGKARAAKWIREYIQNYHLRNALPLRGSVDVERLGAQQML